MTRPAFARRAPLAMPDLARSLAQRPILSIGNQHAGSHSLLEASGLARAVPVVA